MISALPVSGAWVPKTIGAQQGQLHLPVPLAAQFRPEVRGPQVVVPHFLLHGIDDRPQLVIEWMELAAGVEDVEGLDLVRDKLARPVQLLLKLRFGGEIPGHCLPFC
jgi:hypothetical protein